MGDDVVASDHVIEEQWPKRSGDPSIDPVEAWKEADPVEGKHFYDAHSVRRHRPTGTDLLEKNGVIVTVISIDATRTIGALFGG